MDQRSHQGPLPRNSTEWDATPRPQTDGRFAIDDFSYSLLPKIKTMAGGTYGRSVYAEYSLRDIGDSALTATKKLDAWDAMELFLTSAATASPTSPPTKLNIPGDGVARESAMVSNAIATADARWGSLLSGYINWPNDLLGGYLCSDQIACDEAMFAFEARQPAETATSHAASVAVTAHIRKAVGLGFTYCITQKSRCESARTRVGIASIFLFLFVLYAAPAISEAIETYRSGIEATPGALDQQGSRAVLEGVDAGASPRVAQDLAAARAHLDWLENGNISGPNRMMLDRIAEANVTQRELTIAERNFLIHETFEARLVDAGMDQLSAHQLSLQKHPFFANYDPVVVQSFPEWFGPGWRLYWNLG